MVLSKAELVDMVKSLFSEDRKVNRMIVELLLAGKSRITFDEILSITRNIEKSGGAENIAVESTLVMDNRLNRPIPGETYEIPTCISPCVKHSIFSRKFSRNTSKNFPKAGPLYELNKALFIFEL